MNSRPVCIYVGGTNLGQGGAERTHTIGIVSYFATLADVIFIGGYSTPECPPLGISFGSQHIFRVKAGFAAMVRFENRVVSTIKSLLPTLDASGKVFVYSRHRITSFISQRRIQKMGLPYFLEYNDIASVQFDWGIRYRLWPSLGCAIRGSAIFRALLKKSEIYSFANANGVVAITSPIENHIRSIAPSSNVATVGNGCDTKKIVPRDRIECRRLLGLDERGFYFCHIGTLTCWDGLIEALSDWQYVTDKRCHLLIVGSGHVEHQLKEIQKTRNLCNVIFAGQRSHEEALTFLGASDVGLLLKTIDSYGLSPIKLYEYLSAGKPVLTTNIPDIDVVAKIGAGMVLPIPLQKGDISSAILKLAGLPEKKLLDMGNNARRTACEQFDWTRRGSKIWKLIAESMEETP
ncbi:MAG: glycosyltransferase [Syntrophaceae bacterium]|nr:glycosyltransferase [Syntrophaceae bacterium]